MQFPFLNAIKSTTGSAPGTGSFTPNTGGAAGYMDWSNVPTGWWGLVRFEDGTAWELRYCYWNGTAITRPSNIVASSTGSALSLSSSATAEMVADGVQFTSDFGRIDATLWAAVDGNTPSSGGNFGPTPTTTGTAAGVTLATTNFLTAQPRVQFTSATTASAAAGLNFNAHRLASSSAGYGGWEAAFQFGVSQLPTGPRFVAGIWGAGTLSVEPSLRNQPTAAFTLDSTDTNLQLLTNATTTASVNKIDTGIPLVVNSWYYAKLWSLPGSLTVYALLVRLDTGDIFYTSTSTAAPASGSLMIAICQAALNATNTGTAAVIHIGAMTLR